MDLRYVFLVSLGCALPVSTDPPAPEATPAQASAVEVDPVEACRAELWGAGREDEAPTGPCSTSEFLHHFSCSISGIWPHRPPPWWSGAPSEGVSAR